jgi:hypothetical protein
MKKDNKKKIRESDEHEPLNKVESVDLCDYEISFDSKMKANIRYFTFSVSRKHLPQLKSKSDLIILAGGDEFHFGKPLIVQNRETKEFLCGMIRKDKLTSVEFFQDSADEYAFPLLRDEVKIFGEIAAYCPLSAELGVTKNELIFVAI